LVRVRAKALTPSLTLLTVKIFEQLKDQFLYRVKVRDKGKILEMKIRDWGFRILGLVDPIEIKGCANSITNVEVQSPTR
jgi:hypothetical protein